MRTAIELAPDEVVDLCGVGKSLTLSMSSAIFGTDTPAGTETPRSGRSQVDLPTGRPVRSRAHCACPIRRRPSVVVVVGRAPRSTPTRARSWEATDWLAIVRHVDDGDAVDVAAGQAPT